jgi:hypothetical protein
MPNRKKNVQPTSKSGNDAKPIVISSAKYYCTACGVEAEIRYSNWSSVDKGQLVGKDESLCSRCFKQRSGFLMT